MAPIDIFIGTLTMKEAVASIVDEYSYYDDFCMLKEFLEKMLYARNFVFEHSKEFPHTFQMTFLPSPNGAEMKLCIIAKIGNNGTTYFFSDIAVDFGGKSKLIKVN